MGKTHRNFGKNSHPVRARWDMTHDDKRGLKQRKSRYEIEQETDTEEDPWKDENMDDYFWNNYDEVIDGEGQDHE